MNKHDNGVGRWLVFVPTEGVSVEFYHCTYYIIHRHAHCVYIKYIICINIQYYRDKKLNNILCAVYPLIILIQKYVTQITGIKYAT